MSYKVIKDIRAESEIEEFARYAADYSDDWAREQFARLNYVFTVTLAESPITWNEFYVTGLPNRGYFFASADERGVGSSIPSMMTNRPSRCCAFGTPANSRHLSDYRRRSPKGARCGCWPTSLKAASFNRLPAKAACNRRSGPARNRFRAR